MQLLRDNQDARKTADVQYIIIIIIIITPANYYSVGELTTASQVANIIYLYSQESNSTVSCNPQVILKKPPSSSLDAAKIPTPTAVVITITRTIAIKSTLVVIAITTTAITSLFLLLFF